MMDRALDAICRRVKKFDRKFGDERLSKVPRDLDTKPYRDEHDDDSDWRGQTARDCKRG
jgi:hypothetical protein